MNNNDTSQPQTAEILLYATESGAVSVNVYFENETFWMTQKAMAELFDCAFENIIYHLSNIYDSDELSQNATTKDSLVVQTEGKRQVSRKIKHYNLDAIIAVGYRVNSKQATQFRRWATETLREFIVKGFVLNDEMLKNGRPFGKDYFEELLERVREIRASERRFYQKITDIYALSYDYNAKSETTDKFYATVQNKLLFAVTKNTAAEIITDRADSNKKHMGLTSWKNAPNGKILKSDITISKNYLDAKELESLNSIVDMYLSYAENQAKRHKPMSMANWVIRLDSFLQFNEYDILENAGKISQDLAKELVSKEYDQFRVTQDKEYKSDFDKLTSKLLEKKQK